MTSIPKTSKGLLLPPQNTGLWHKHLNDNFQRIDDLIVDLEHTGACGFVEVPADVARISDIEAAIAPLASMTYVDDAIRGLDVGGGGGGTVDLSGIEAAIALKADASALAAKADQSTVTALSATVATKADASALSAKVDQTVLQTTNDSVAANTARIGTLETKSSSNTSRINILETAAFGDAGSITPNFFQGSSYTYSTSVGTGGTAVAITEKNLDTIGVTISGNAITLPLGKYKITLAASIGVGVIASVIASGTTISNVLSQSPASMTSNQSFLGSFDASAVFESVEGSQTVSFWVKTLTGTGRIGNSASYKTAQVFIESLERLEVAPGGGGGVSMTQVNAAIAAAIPDVSGFATKTYVDGQIGDISTALAAILGE